MGYSVRPMQAGDISQVSKIDREAFPTQWPPPAFKKDLSNNVVRYLVAFEGKKEGCYQTGIDERGANGNSPGLLSKIWRLFGKNHSSSQGVIARNSQTILGYASIWLMVDESHLTSIAVSEVHRRKGIGELLLISIIELSMQLNAQVVTLEVRTSNIAAQSLYEKYGFAKVGLRRGYYTEDGEDAVIMTTESINSSSYQTTFKELKRQYVERWGAMQERSNSVSTR